MDIEPAFFYITPDELEAGALADPNTEWNKACTLSNFVFRIHSEGWHFRLDIAHLDDYRSSLEDAAVLPVLNEQSSYFERSRLIKGQITARELLALLSEIESVPKTKISANKADSFVT